MVGALAAIALLLAGGLAAVLLLERYPASAPRRVDPAVPGPRTVATPLAVPTPPPSAVARAVSVPAPAAQREPPLPLDMAARKRALDPLRDEVFAGLAMLDERVSRCGRPMVYVALTLETLDRRVHVLDVQVNAPDPTEVPEGLASLPAESGEWITCVRSVLLDEMLSAPSARPGRLWEMAYVPGAH